MRSTPHPRYRAGTAICLMAVLAWPAQATAGEPGSPLFCKPGTTADWLQAQALARPPQPMDCAVIDHDPPVFAWHAQAGADRYEVRLQGPQGATTLASTSPWLFWPKRLGAGEYTWQVRAGTGDWSASRRFRIGQDAGNFTVPDVATLFKRAATTARPRALPRGSELDMWRQSLAGERASGWRGMTERVRRRATEALPGEPKADPRQLTDWDARARISQPLMNDIVKLAEAAREAALRAQIERSPEAIAEAKRRVLHLARLNPDGATSFKAEPGSARRLVWTLAVTYDWLHGVLDRSEQEEIRHAVQRRMPDLLASVLDPREGVGNRPLSSYANESLPSALTIASLMAGDLAEAEGWFRTLLPTYLAWLSAWGGEDGGFAQGTNYLIWAIETPENWDILRWTTGVDVTRKSWLRNLGRTMVYFVPPGSPVGSFGDGAEVDNREVNDRLFRAYAARVPSTLYRWYAGQLFGGDETRLSLLLSPPLTRGGPLPAGTPNSLWQPSTGWVAMHSSLADRARMSVYFKSSPYGSLSHSHADQNGFVINARGQALMIDSGRYDYYASPHHLQWAKTTAAHNAITFDGGKGQSLGSDGRGDAAARGRITEFRHETDADIVSGDATAAYGGALRDARRTLVYLRPSTLLVFDTLAADAPRRWEWNLHAAAPPTQADDASFVLKAGETRLCGRIAADRALRLETGWATIPPASGSTPSQWHARYATADTSGHTTFAAVLALDCDGELPQALPSGGGWQVTGPGWRVTYRNGVATVERPLSAQEQGNQ